MPIGSPRSRRRAPRLVAMLVLAATAALRGAEGGPVEDSYEVPTLERLDRSVALVRPEDGDRGDDRRRWLTWRAEYRLRNAGDEPLLVDPAALSCTVEGWASNSRADGHGLPRRADHALGAGSAFESVAVLNDAESTTMNCRERATLQVWHGEESSPPEPAAGSCCSPLTAPFEVLPGAVLCARLRLEHQHNLHGPTEPLLGDRELTLRIGPASFRDEVPLERPGSAAGPIDRLEAVPDDRLDRRYYRSAPGSLYLDAALPGLRSYQFRDLQVRRDAPMRLSFCYLRPSDSDGIARAELKQYHDVPHSYRALTEAKHVEVLDQDGEWVRVVHTFRTRPEATTVQLKFILDCENNGPAAVWIDDVALVPLDGTLAEP